MPLDPQVQIFLEQLRQSGAPPLCSLTPQEARAGAQADAAALGPSEPVAGKDDLDIAGPCGPLPIRLYTACEILSRGLLVYFHGGGWVIGDVTTHDALCCALANAAGCRLVSVDYRLAPEHKYPAAAEDAFAATQWAVTHAAELGADPTRVAVGGDSAGGNLAAVVALMARDRAAFSLAHQTLIYPVTNYAFGTDSYRENAEGYLLTRADMQWFWHQYLVRPEQGHQPYASPLQAGDLHGLPQALVITAEYDPLRDEGEAYARRLIEAQVPVSLLRYEGMIHAFIRRFGQFNQARAALSRWAAALRQAFR